MPSLKTYRVFISHAWKYSDDYYRIVEMLDNASNFEWRNYSVPEHDPRDANNKTKLREALRNQIRPVHIVVILAGMYTNYSDWIEFEMDFSDEIAKPMIGVRPWGQQRVPTEVQNRVKTMVGWNTRSITDAIRKHSL